VSRTRAILVGMCMLLLCATLGVSAEENWNLSKLNPFGSSKSTKATKTAKPKNSLRKTQPSTWDKVTGATKNAVTKTNETLNPWAKKSTTSKRASTKQAANRPKSSEKPSMWERLVGKEEDKRPKTVSEFINLPKPK
jgi:hypothetical protein